ncbi:acyltransferase family protein [Xanthomonas nasturtii]|uniref:acyltransferase family protein n=1 Tax=Xanthomonas nasturtii TaxID=1843581 RepID=UPI002012381C|nr:acyltransferase [Xanthomonas nasturtii]MCL1526240.1 acyltransferase [Xanthomonas nasturtii]MCL1533569.1 acyltransferase [Xanthomonas nasturtii]MCL1543774.1 acyltransferase [Xanthomonas nasturtii]
MPRSILVADGLARRQDNFLWVRIVAAILVIYGHSFHIAPNGIAKEVFIFMGWNIYSGDIAVNMFFVISGFMIAGSFVRQPDLWEFMKARFLRVCPAFFACLMIMALIVGPFTSSLSLASYFQSKETFSYIYQNLTFSSAMQFTLPGVFEGGAVNVVNGSLWTLPAEFRMYVFVAIIGSLGILKQRWGLLGFILALVLLGMIAPWDLPLHPDWVRLAGYFAIGVLIFAFKDRLSVSTSGMVAIAFATYLCRGLDIYLYMFAFALSYFCFWFAYALRLPSIERWGDPSYAIYLWGWPTQQMFVRLFPGETSTVNFLLSAAVAVGVGYLSWHVIEKPCLKLKHFFSRKSPAVVE